VIARRLLLSVLSLLATALLFSGAALASGGNYVFQGGTPAQQQTVKDALNASTFNWSLVTQQITINIAPVAVDDSTPGTINLDPSLLNSGEFAWGVVQNEYANQVDFYLLPQSADATFNSALGGTVWCRDDQAGLQTQQYGCERFASTLAWAYWQNPENCINPQATGGISGSMAPAAFRALLTSTLGVPTQTATPVAAPAAVAPPVAATPKPATTTVFAKRIASTRTTQSAKSVQTKSKA
jgi:hypothetical protein